MAYIVTENNEVFGTKTGKVFFTGLDQEDCKRWIRNKRANRNRKMRDSLMRDFGLVKVRGALGGTYWE